MTTNQVSRQKFHKYFGNGCFPQTSWFFLTPALFPEGDKLLYTFKTCHYVETVTDWNKKARCVETLLGP